MKEARPLWIFAVLIAFVFLEGAWILWVQRKHYDLRETFTSFVIAIGQGISNRLSYFFIYPFLEWIYAYRLFTLTIQSVFDFVIFFVALDFVYYWQHRLSHEIRWLWASHSVHHSVQQLNYSAAYRLAWTGWLSGFFLFFVPLVWLGYHPADVMGFYGLSLIYQFWLHTELVPKLGWLEYFLNTPSHHRVHHAKNTQYIDRNYGGVLIIFDRIFGTLAVENEKCVYGLVGKTPSSNPIRVVFDEWLSIARDVSRSKNWRDRWHYAFGAPGIKRRPSVENSADILPQVHG